MVVCRLGRDRGVGGNAFGGKVCIVGQRVERSSVEGEGDLNLGFVGVAVYESSAPERWFGHYGEKGLKDLMVFSDTKIQSKREFFRCSYTEQIVHGPKSHYTLAPVSATLLCWQTTFANASSIELLPIWKPPI